MAIKPVELLIRVRDEASSALGSVQAKVTAVAAAVAGFFTATLFAKSIGSAKELEAALSRVAAAADGGEQELLQLRAAAEDAGASTTYTSVEAAGALENLVKAGLDAKTAIGALPAVLALAQAGDIELAQSADYVTKAMAGMGLAVGDTGRIADVLAKGANASNTSVQGLGQALSYAAPMAKSLKLPLETVVALIGKLADAGIDASRAGTALNSIFAQFSNPASTFRRELSAIGITTNDFEKALHQLAAAGSSGSKAILAVGQEAGPALQSLLNQGMGALDGLKQSLLDAEGSAKATADTMNNNLTGAAAGFASAWDALLIKLGTPVLPALKDGVNALTERLRAFIDGGTAARFGEALAAGFKAGLDWAQQFFGRVDFDALASKMEAFAGKAAQTFETIGQRASQAGATVELVWNTMAGGVNAVMAAIYTVAEGFSGVASKIQSGVAVILEGLAKITFGGVSESFAEAAKSVRESAEATWAVSEEFARKAADSFISMGDHAQKTRDAWADLTAETSTAASAQRSVAEAVSGTTKALDDQAAAAARTGDAATKAAEQQRQAASEARAAIEEMRGQYRSLIEGGDLQGAAQLLVEIQQASRDAAQGMGELGGEAEDAAAKIKAAFEAAGIKTKDELKSLAERAREEFQTIKNSGQATAEGVASSWKRAAEAAIQAADGIVPGWVQAEASINGYVVRVDEAGKATLQVADVTKQAANDMAGGWRQVGRAVQDATADLLDFEKRSAAISAANVRGSDAYKKKWGVDGNNMAVNTDGQMVMGMEQEFQVNQRVARLYGKEMVGNANAIKAANLAQQMELARKYGVYKEAGNLRYYEQLQNELRRLGDEINKERKAMAAEKAAAAGAPSSDAPTRTTGASASFNTTININGRSRNIATADRESQQELQALVRDLTDAKGRAA